MKTGILIAILAALFLPIIAGCGNGGNPVTPEKMSEMRKKEAEERANFDPNNVPGQK